MRIIGDENCSFFLKLLLLFSYSVVSNSTTPWTAALQASLFFSISQFAQTHVHWVNDAIQPSHPLSPPSFPALNLSQHQGPFQWVSSSHQVAKASVFPMNIQDWFPLGWTGWISLQSKGLSRAFSNTTVRTPGYSHLTNEVRWPRVYWAIPNENPWLIILTYGLTNNC